MPMPAMRRRASCVESRSVDPSASSAAASSTCRPKRHTVMGRRASETDAFNAKEEYQKQKRVSPSPPSAPIRHQQIISDAPPSNLIQVLQRWSHQAPTYRTLHPLQKLLVTVPTIFPPHNKHVGDHKYFVKWKVFSEDAFDDNDSDEELKDLLKRAVRKARFYLHPDRIPSDLTESQALLFKTVWGVISEAATVL